MTKDRMMDLTPWLIMGCSVTMLLLTVQDIVTKW
jgi:hypothetical protein